MGFGIELQDEWGGKIEGVYDPKNLLDALLPDIDADTLFQMLSSLDPYGDTTFNYLQMRRFLQEWTEVSTKAQSPEEKDLFSKIEHLAKRCQDEVHVYLKFIGD